MAVVIVVALILLAIVGFGVALARSGRAQYEAQGQVVPGLASEAPAHWAGAHTPEARMHRRLGEAVRALRAVAGADGEDMRLLELRIELEQQALEVDRQLILAAALPEGVRGPALERVERAVVAVEQASGQLAAQVALGSSADARGLQDLVDRIRIAAEARAELEALEGFTTSAPGTGETSGGGLAEGRAVTGEDPQGTDDDRGTPQPGTA